MSLSSAARVGLLSAALAGSLVACGGGGGDGGGGPARVATSITISPGPNASVQSGATIQMQAIVKDQNGEVMEGQAVTWSSSNEAKATISSTGLVTGIAVGATTINAAIGTLVFATPVTLSVTAGAAVVISKFTELQPTMSAGSSDSVRVRVFDAAGNPVSGVTVTFAVTGDGASLGSTTAVTNLSGIAAARITVGSVAGVAVSVTATAPGLNTVTFTTTVGAGAPAVVRVTSPRIVIIDQGASTILTFTVTDAAGNVISGTSGFTIFPRGGNVSTSGTTITGATPGQTFVIVQSNANPAVRDSMLAVVAIPTGPVVRTDLSRFDLKTDTTFTVAVIVDMRSSGERLGSTRIQLTWDPTVLAYQSDAEGASSVGAVVNNTQAASNGTLTLAVASSAGFAGAVEVRRITFRSTATANRATSIALATTELNGISPTFTDLKPKTVSVTYPLFTR